MVWKYSQLTDKWWVEYLADEIYDYGPRLKNTGLPVWVLVGNYKLYNGDKDRVLYGFRDWLTAADVEAALAYYEDFPEDIDRKLQSMAAV